MNRCQCQGIEIEFGRKVAAKDLKRYRKQGPNKTTRLLIDALKTEAIKGMTLLDIGGGIGAIQHELLRAGMSSAMSVEASAAYSEATIEEARRQGHPNRINSRHGDFVALAADIPPADIVTLDRVVCCYPDMQALVELSSARARKLYGVVFPLDAWWMKFAFHVLNLLLRLQRSLFRVFLHPAAAVDAAVRSHGLERRFYRKTPVWQVVVYGR